MHAARLPVATSLALALAACGGGDSPGTGSSDPFANAGPAGGSAGNGAGSTGTNANGQMVNYYPMFPGSGTDPSANLPLPGGMICDAVPGVTTEALADVTRCFFGPDDKVHPAATVEQVLECVEGSTAVHLRLTFDPTFADNSYGVNGIGWPAQTLDKNGQPKGGHTFEHLVKSDHAVFVLVDGNGDTAMQFALDYLTEDTQAASGYASLGVMGGEGMMVVGDASHVVDWSTSIDRNLNERGYGSYLVDSPATDDLYTPSQDAPDWDYRVVYEAWVDLDAFGDAGFAGAFIDFVHASPSKLADNTVEVTPGECPPCMSDAPDESLCSEGGDPGDPPGDSNPCTDGDPSTVCEAPPYCVQYPTDPMCTVQ